MLHFLTYWLLASLIATPIIIAFFAVGARGDVRDELADELTHGDRRLSDIINAVPVHNGLGDSA